MDDNAGDNDCEDHDKYDEDDDDGGSYRIELMKSPVHARITFCRTAGGPKNHRCAHVDHL